MARRSTPTRLQAERTYPFKVDVPVPALGLGARLNEMHAWAREHVGLPPTLLTLETPGDPEVPKDSAIDRIREAEGFASALDWSAEVGRPWDYDCTKYGGRRIYITRQGAAVTIRIDEARRALTPSLAKDLAEAVREVIERTKSLRGKAVEVARKPPVGVSSAEFRAACEVTW